MLKLMTSLCLCLSTLSYGFSLPLVDAFNQHHIMALSVKDLQTGEMLFNKHGDLMLPPASTLKLATAFAAIHQIDRDTSLDADFKAFGRVERHSFYGDIELSFDQDPSFDRKTLVEWFSAFASQHNFDHLEGNIVIKDAAHPIPGVFFEETADCYASKPHDAIINRNCLTLKITPGKQGQTAKIESLNKLPGILIDNQVVTTHTCNSDNNTSVHTSWSDTSSNIITLPEHPLSLHGCISTTHQPLMIKISPEHQPFIRANIIRALKQSGLSHDGDIIWSNDSRPPSDHALFHTTHHSKPMIKMIHKMLQDSDNHIAHTLFNHSTHHTQWQDQEADIKQTLLQHGVDLSSASITEGSGLSRNNAISTHQMIELLDAIYHDPLSQEMIVPSLPISGLSGTLSYRFRHLPKGTLLKAKTGTLKQVKSLAGYLIIDKHPYALALIAMGDKSTPDALLDVEDTLFSNLVTMLRHHQYS